MADAAPAALGTVVYGTMSVIFAVAAVVFSVTDEGTNVAVTPVGRPVAVDSAWPLNPDFGVMVTVTSSDVRGIRRGSRRAEGDLESLLRCPDSQAEREASPSSGWPSDGDPAQLRGSSLGSSGIAGAPPPPPWRSFEEPASPHPIEPIVRAASIEPRTTRERLSMVRRLVQARRHGFAHIFRYRRCAKRRAIRLSLQRSTRVAPPLDDVSLPWCCPQRWLAIGEDGSSRSASSSPRASRYFLGDRRRPSRSSALVCLLLRSVRTRSKARGGAASTWIAPEHLVRLSRSSFVEAARPKRTASGPLEGEMTSHYWYGGPW